MERRKFLIGASSAAVGASALIGSGAFSTVQADRQMELSVVNDPSAYLGLQPTSDHASTVDGKLQLDFSRVNQDALTEFNNVFDIRNRGSKTIRVFVDHTDVDDDLNFTMYPSEPGNGGVEGTLTGTGGTTSIPPNSNVGVVIFPGGVVPASCVFGAWDSEVDLGDFDEELSIYAVANDSNVYPNSGPADANHGTDPSTHTVPRYD